MSARYQLNRTALVWQLIAGALVVLPHLSHLPIWLPLLALGALGWRFLVHRGRLSYPNRVARLMLVLACSLALVVSYGGVAGINGMVALLIMGFALKSLEIFSRRDALLVTYLAYLVAASALLFEQGIWMAAYVLLSVQVTTAALIATYQTRQQDWARPFRSSAFLMMQALPLMLVLFVVIPRMPPLWSVNIPSGSAKTGLSDTMSPGDITRLTRSAEVAFRVQFEGPPPAQSQLYWRAMTYPDFDGRRWYRAADLQAGVTQRLHAASNEVRYSVLLEATDQHYVPALDLPVITPGGYTLLPDATLYRQQAFTGRDQYRLTSVLDYTLGGEREVLDFTRELTLPEGNPRSRAAALQWYREAGGAEAYIAALNRYFNRSFYYSLRPPALGNHSVDQFMFDTRKGFCGHFAGAMVFMLRTAGIPARVVAGYQGGEWNPYEGYLLVRQFDAHAWVEAWLPEQGWVRLDPTAAVSPARVERPAEELFNHQDGFLDEAPLSGLTLRAGSWVSGLRLQWDAINFGWQRWVVNYHTQQNHLLQRLLGAVTPWRLALALLAPFALVMAIVAVKLLWQTRSKPQNRFDRELGRFSLALAGQGMARRPGETVSNYCRRVADVRQELTPLLTEIGACYDQLRYAGADPAVSGERLIRLLRECRAKL